MLEGNTSLKILDTVARKSRIPDSCIVKAMTGLFAPGKRRFADIDAYCRNEPFLDFLAEQLGKVLSGKKSAEKVSEKLHLSRTVPVISRRESLPVIWA